MPPPQCPECGRFLSKDFVRGLLAEPAACPRCGTTLDAERFHGSEVLQTAPEPLAESVRPPDLPPETVRPAEERDVLAGWDQPPAPAAAEPAVAGDAGVARAAGLIVGAGVLGGAIGALASRRRRLLLTVVGTLLGALAALVTARLSGPR